MLSDKHLEDYRFYLSKDGLPKGWEVVSLSDVSTKITDGTHKTPKYQPCGVRFISIKNIKRYRPVDWLSYEKYISPEEHAELTKRCKPEFNDILFPRIGTLGYAKRVDFEEEVSIFVGLGLIKPIHEAVLPKYLEYYMNTGYIDRLSREKANGSGRLTLPLAQTKKFPIPIPPIQEQVRIVEKIDTLFARLDKGEEAVREVQKLLSLYRQSVLKSAVTGQLTADWRAERRGELEHGRDLQARLLTRRRDTWEGRGKYKEPVEPEPEALPKLPDEWTWATLDQLVAGKARSMQSGPFGSSLKHSEFSDQGVLVVGIDNVRDGFFSMGSQNRIPPQKYAELEKYTARAGDLLITVMASLGKSCVIPDDLETAIITKHVYRISMEQDLVAPDFYNKLLQTEWISRRRMFENAQGQTRPGLNSSILRALPVPLLTREEQEEILKRLEVELSKVEALERQVEVELKRSASLRQSILKDAFAGRLVPQDPNDEPASALLARIQAERPRKLPKTRKQKAKV